MHSLSMTQALSVWSELESAYYGKNRFGGDTAEIYAYRLQPSNPTASRGNPASQMCRQAQEEAAKQAAHSLLQLLLIFSKSRRCKITVDEQSFRKALAQPLHHRCHVRIEKPAK